MRKSTPNEIIAEPVLNALSEAIARGDNGDWKPPWRKMATDGIPLRSCGEPYHGINVFLLSLSAAVNGYTSQYWFTYNDAKKHGWQVRKGEKSTPICFYKSYPKKDKETGENVTIRVLRYYRVFNGSQIDNIDAKYITPASTADLPNGVTDFDALRIIKSVGVPVDIKGGRACYIPSADRIELPEIERFESNAGFSGTALHELTHATGHTSRLDRKLTGRFGDNAYAAEELIAEFGATILCATFGLEYKLEHHASYLEHWHRALKSNPKILTTAGAAAQKAAQYVLDAVALADQQVAA